MEYLGDILKVCGIGVLCAIFLAVFGKMSGSLGMALRVGGGMLVFGIFLAVLTSNIDELENIFISAPVDASVFSRAFSLMLKALGIALVSKFCADICRDCGESTLAGGIESVGRVAIFSLCIPIISDILSHAAQVLDKGG